MPVLKVLARRLRKALGIIEAIEGYKSTWPISLDDWITEIEFGVIWLKFWEKTKRLGRGLYSLKMQTFFYFSFAIKGINPFQFLVKAYIAILFLKI